MLQCVMDKSILNHTIMPATDFPYRYDFQSYSGFQDLCRRLQEKHNEMLFQINQFLSDEKIVNGVNIYWYKIEEIYDFKILFRRVSGDKYACLGFRSEKAFIAFSLAHGSLLT